MIPTPEIISERELSTVTKLSSRADESTQGVIKELKEYIPNITKQIAKLNSDLKP